MEEADRKRRRPAEDWEDRSRRRRTGFGGDVGKPCRGRTAADEAAVAADGDVEDEVEEFFTIVRRMHAAAAQSSAGGGRRRTAPGQEEGKGICRWHPAFELEDFQEGGDRKLPDGGCGGRGEAALATSAPVAAAGRAGRREGTAADDAIAVCLDLNAEPEPERVLE